ncbi:serine hydrolase [cf. Phormidesmis sp. LEGE 11477]|uniref:serine hydrolase n=1 Tax=cf. Phormidesmis sp. LEGE 11477 TaxID=1828680 RepID=UPI0018815FC6|nr:serine hydrolase [cf. Phormidesmis sp. LEGE 11477]MBE9063998.1 serine hydrolase [cf. Phormidesmis sp. LEGE 11477]
MPAKFFAPTASLQTQLDQVLDTVWDTYPDLAQNQIAITWITYAPPYRMNTGGALSAEDFWQYQPEGASYRGVELIDPGNLAHLFYLVAIHVWLEQGMVQPAADTERAIANMIQQNSHDAASYLVDILAGVSSGPALPEGPMTTWQYQRNIVNRYFSQLGWLELRSININQKTWHEGPYGRELLFFGETFDNRNQLTAEAITRLLHSIIGGVSVTSRRSQSMMQLLKAQTEKTPTDSTDSGLPSPADVWQIATTEAQISHSAAYVEAEGIHPYLLIVLSEHAASTSTQDVVSLVNRLVFERSQLNFKTVNG